MNLNKAIVAGNLTRDPETRTLPSGQTLASFGVATNRVWTNQDGQKQEATEFHNVTAFGKLADICAQYLTKGRLVLIEGRIQTRSWQGQDGVKRYRTEIIAENMQMGPRWAAPGQATSPMPPAEPKKVEETPMEEIPVIEVEETPEEPASSEENPDLEEQTKEPAEATNIIDSDDKGQVEVKNIPF